MGYRTTNPILTSRRLRSLKLRMSATNREIAEEFMVTEKAVEFWLSARHTPRLRHQRLLERLEIAHGLRE